MSNSRYSLANYALSAALMNGTGGAPTRDETAPLVMERAFTADRKAPWKSSGSGGTPNFDLNLSPAKAAQ